MSRSRSGQLFTADMVMSALIFLGIVNLALIAWNTTYEAQTRFDADRSLRDRVDRVSHLIVHTEGYPSNWTADTVRVLGFASQGHELSPRKLSEFADMTPAEQRDAIRANGASFHLNVTADGRTVSVDDPGGGTLPLVFGTPVAADATTAAANRRTVLVPTENGTRTATLTLVFWR